MYIRNITNLIGEMGSDEEISLNFRSGISLIVRYDDEYQNVNGDLKFIRKISENRKCIFIVDCAEVESIILKKAEIL